MKWDSMNAVGRAYEALPIDFTPGGLPGRPACWRVDTGIGADERETGGLWNMWTCTRPVDHGGRHAAGDGYRIRAVW